MKHFSLFPLLLAVMLLAGCAATDDVPDSVPESSTVNTVVFSDVCSAGVDTLDGMLSRSPVIAHATVATIEHPYTHTNSYTMTLHKSTQEGLGNFTIWIPQSFFELTIGQEVILLMHPITLPPEYTGEGEEYFYPRNGERSVFLYDDYGELQGVFLEELLQDLPEPDKQNPALDTVYDQLIYRMEHLPLPEDLIPERPEITVEASYENSFSSVDELLALDRVIIVRAKPVSIFLTLDTMVIYNMEVLESNADQFGNFRLRQARDHYLLVPGQEVVLVLQPPPTNDYCEIPNGGDGLFREDENGVMTGNLLPSLLENVPAAAISPENISLTKVYEMLIDRLP